MCPIPCRDPGDHTLRAASGGVCVLDRVPRPLSPEQADALRALARQAANLLELGRYATEKERVEPVMVERVPLSALGSDISLALIRGDDLRVILQRCVEAVVRRLDVAFARIWTLEPGGDVLELRASAGLYTHLDGPHARVPLGCFKIGRIALENHPHLTNDVLHDSWVGDPEWARREGMVAFAGYPLAVEDRVVGVMAAFAYRPLPQAALEALGSISDAIAQCIEASGPRRSCGGPTPSWKSGCGNEPPSWPRSIGRSGRKSPSGPGPRRSCGGRTSTWRSGCGSGPPSWSGPLPPCTPRSPNGGALSRSCATASDATASWPTPCPRSSGPPGPTANSITSTAAGSTTPG